MKDRPGEARQPLCSPADPEQQQQERLVSVDKVVAPRAALATAGLVVVAVFAASCFVLARNPASNACWEDDACPEYVLPRFSAHYQAFLGVRRTCPGVLLPATIHSTLGAEDLGRGRVIVVGDVHGTLATLHALLAKVNTTDEDTVILVGDLVDKGPRPIEVVRKARTHGWRAVRGNHDDAALAAAEAAARGEALRRKHAWVRGLAAPDIAFLAALPWSISVPSHGLVVVHAGLVPGVPLTEQRLGDLYYMREVVPGEAHKWRGIEAKHDRGTLGQPWARVWAGPQHIVFGHDHQRGLQEEAYATGVDTGACYGQELSAVVLPGVAEVAQRRQRWANATAGITLAMLGGSIMSIPAQDA